MNLEELAVLLSEVVQSGRSVFLRTEPEVPDHTTRAPFKIIIHGKNQRIDLDITAENLLSVVAQFDSTIFNKEWMDRIYAWNFKSLCTYFHACCPSKYIAPTASVIDLKCIEYFLGIRKKCPENMTEVIDRTRPIASQRGWQSIYKTVHLPLSLKILPSIEATPLLNEAAKRTEFPYYEIEGIKSGRLNCSKPYTKCYIPHRIGPEERRNMKPRGYGFRFLVSDFRYCEVTVLQWLSNDPKFKELIDSGADVYAGIYEAITENACDTPTKRNIGKQMILSVLYGSGPRTLSETLSLPEAVTKELIKRIRIVYRQAWDWMTEQREKAKHNIVTDYFGRPRDFREKPFSAPDVMVQGIAATVCQEKLIDLFNRLDDPTKAYILYSVHDGFGVAVKANMMREYYKIVKETLEVESTLCPNLKLKVQIKFGARLENMQVIWTD